MVESSPYGAKTSAEEIASANVENVRGKYVIVTGANTGLGKETARVMYKYGAHVTVVCRSQEKADKTAKDIEESVGNFEGKGSLTGMEMDLSSMESVSNFATKYIERKVPLHIIIANAGVMNCPRQFTKDNIEYQFGINHIGHFIMVTKLLDVLKKSGTEKSYARCVILSSAAHGMAYKTWEENFGDMTLEKNYGGWAPYGRSKLCNLLFAKQLAKHFREEKAPVYAYSLHPGIIPTDLGRHMDPAVLKTMPYGKTIPQGAATSVYCATDPRCASEEASGKYYDDCNVKATSHPLAEDMDAAQKLWDISVGIAKNFL